MSWLSGLTSGAGSFLGSSLIAGTNLLSGGLNFYQQYKAYKEQKRYNAWYQNFSENQHAIAAEDLENAGLSKTLAAGSANSAAPVKVGSAAQFNASVADALNFRLAAAKTKSEIDAADLSGKIAKADLALRNAQFEQSKREMLFSDWMDWLNQNYSGMVGSFAKPFMPLNQLFDAFKDFHDGKIDGKELERRKTLLEEQKPLNYGKGRTDAPDNFTPTG